MSAYNNLYVLVEFTTLHLVQVGIVNDAGLSSDDSWSINDASLAFCPVCDLVL
jgi:hypothetical protein